MILFVTCQQYCVEMLYDVEPLSDYYAKIGAQLEIVEVEERKLR